MGHRDRAGADDQGVKSAPHGAARLRRANGALIQQKVSRSNLQISGLTHEAPGVRVKARVTSSLGGNFCHEYLIGGGWRPAYRPWPWS